MKKNVIIAIRLTIFTLLLFAVVYPLVVLGIAQAAPNKGNGEVIHYKNTKYYANIGQQFTSDEYFWGRPSAVNYNAAKSGASNKAPSNKDYLAEVSTRIDSFLVRNPGVARRDIPVEMVTASGSGLDPDISIRAAQVQVRRISRARGISEARLSVLIDKQATHPLLGIFGTERVNVLRLNIALDNLK